MLRLAKLYNPSHSPEYKTISTLYVVSSFRDLLQLQLYERAATVGLMEDSQQTDQSSYQPAVLQSRRQDAGAPFDYAYWFLRAQTVISVDLCVPEHSHQFPGSGHLAKIAHYLQPFQQALQLTDAPYQLILFSTEKPQPTM
jgi:hypothetical protein